MNATPTVSPTASPAAPPWNYLVAVPSYRRAATLNAKTLRTLAAGNVPRARIAVYVADTDEYDAYKAVLDPALYGSLEVSAPTLAGSRNHIVRAYPPGTRVVFADDDLTGLSVRVNAKQLAPLTDIPGLIRDAFGYADMAGARLWGIHPVDNPLFMNARTRTDLRYIVGCFYGITLRGDDADTVTLEDKEDFERTLRCYTADGALIRLDWACPTTRYYTEPGGMQETRTPARVDASARALARRYPALCKAYRAKSGRLELRLKDRRTPPPAGRP